MNKITAIIASIVLLVPAVSLAAGIKTINGFDTTNQFVDTTSGTMTMHMQVVDSAGHHTFQWDNTPWRVDQGGTGRTSFTNGSVLFYANGFSEDNTNFFWNASNKFLGIGTNTPSAKLDVVGNVKLSDTLFAGALNITNTSTLVGPVTVGSSNPLQHALHIIGSMYSQLVTASGSTIDWNAGNVQRLTLTSNPTLSFANGQPGGEYKLILKQDNVGGHTVTWPSDVLWPSDSAPTLPTNPNSIDVISFVKDGSDYLGSFSLNYSRAPAQDCTGGTITHIGGNTIHKFTSSGTLDCTSAGAKTAQYLVAAGGGGGGSGGPDGNNAGGGGGAGGVLTGTFSVSPQMHNITVGAGGFSDTNGGNSVFVTVTTVGGGKGGRNTTNTTDPGNNGGNGGSGGGGSYLGNAGGTGIAGQGNDGAIGQAGGGASGGGGGASAPGSPAAFPNPPVGGDGITSSISGSPVYYGGGGAGSWQEGTTVSGGLGGGGYSPPSNSSSPGGDGAANTGGGGGGANGLHAAGGAGGSGIVIISYPTP